jgi:hypothetical protein
MVCQRLCQSSKDFYCTKSSRISRGSLQRKGKAVKPFTIAEANIWLREEQSSHKGPSVSGVESWDIARRPSNAICEDNLVTAHVGVNLGEPWLSVIFSGQNFFF